MIIEKDELTIYEVESLYQELLREFEGDLVSIDMKNVNKIDMSIIQLFVSTQKSCKESSKRFELKNLNQEVSDILKKSACEFLTGGDHE